MNFNKTVFLFCRHWIKPDPNIEYDIAMLKKNKNNQYILICKDTTHGCQSHILLLFICLTAP